MSNLINWLFETKAVRVCPENKPFWYTSGTIGPYYINTHFLYGSEDKANELLKIIDETKSDKLNCPKILLEKIRSNYNNDAIFKGLIDEMLVYIKNNIDVNSIDYISGGERRDWFFSLIIAEMLGKPHIMIFKDLTAVASFSDGDISQDSTAKEVATLSLSGSKVLHIADLITEASSYERAWIPAIKSFGGEMLWSLVVVDRKQGGGELLEKNNVKSFTLVSIDKGLFEKVQEMGLINKEQYGMLIEFAENPKESMKQFLKKHPEFMEDALNSDEKTKERAKLCMEKKFYE